MQDVFGKVIWFEFQKLKYLYDKDEKKEFVEIDFPVDHTFKYYQESKGYQEEDDVTIAIRKYGANKYVNVLCPLLPFLILNRLSEEQEVLPQNFHEFSTDSFSIRANL